MTLAVAWIRRIADCEELVVATDSRLSGGRTIDGCAKIILLPRTDAFLACAGDTDITYPLAHQVSSAIAAYERTQLLFDTPFDRFIAGDATALDDAAKRGLQLFNARGRCNKCHALSSKEPDPTNFTDNDFHNIGIGIIRHHVVPIAHRALEQLASGDMLQVDRAAIQTDMSVLGRFLVTKQPAQLAAFKCPEALCVVDELPKTATEKIAKNVLRDRLVEPGVVVERMW